MAKALEKYERNVNLMAPWKKISLPALGLITLIISGCQGMPQSADPTTFPHHDADHGSLPPATTVSLSPTEPPPSAPPAQEAFDPLPLTPSELQEFDNIMLELDPDQQLVTNITQWKLSTTVHVTTGPGFATLSQERQNEIKIAMGDGLRQVCLCSPHLQFNTENNQQLVDIDQQAKWQ